MKYLINGCGSSKFNDAFTFLEKRKWRRSPSNGLYAVYSNKLGKAKVEKHARVEFFNRGGYEISHYGDPKEILPIVQGLQRITNGHLITIDDRLR